MACPILLRASLPSANSHDQGEQRTQSRPILSEPRQKIPPTQGNERIEAGTHSIGLHISININELITVENDETEFAEAMLDREAIRRCHFLATGSRK